MRCRRSRPSGSTEPAKLSLMLRGELDWIVMKALEKDRNRRYETANGLAPDIQRYLHDEPVRPARRRPVYRFRKFARRHKGTLVTAATLAVMLLVGTAISALAGHPRHAGGKAGPHTARVGTAGTPGRRQGAGAGG